MRNLILQIVVLKHINEGNVCDDTNLIVSKSQGKGANKKYFCMYCKKLQTKFARNLETIHKNKADVKKLIYLSKGEYNNLCTCHSESNVNFLYNTFSQLYIGEWLVSRRSLEANKSASDFIACPKCKSYYTKNNVRHHFQNCNGNNIGRRVMILGRKIHSRIHFRAKLCRKFRNQRHHDIIRAELRLLGLNFDSDINKFKTPSIATRIGTLLKKLGNLLQTEYIKKMIMKVRNVENFMELLQKDYGTTINKIVEETVIQNKRHSIIELPSMNDIKKKRNILYNELIKSCNSRWLELLKVTLISMQVYNRRKVGEIEKVLEGYKYFKNIGEHTNLEVYNSLSKTGKEVIEKYVTFDRDKLGCTVPVLLHLQLQDCIKLFLQYRSKTKTKLENSYLFGIPGYHKHRYKYLKAYDLMQKYSSKCGAEKSFTLRGIKLRKHIATKCITLNLSESEVTELANFMDHDKTKHKSHYRQSIPEIDISRFSQLLNIAIFNVRRIIITMKKLSTALFLKI
ncbi:hypothetical protein ALC56_11642 [Trachymyrmex septentrionalis]|uniref:Uncharacterized protein n=1 Tax=Trachymyrmex septentrionalis TaxID=34720 RepID=A0A151JTR4_9HYME|nr:hypothetical protein ALC56_11642 [Trachymyrmex septentrionalis]